MFSLLSVCLFTGVSCHTQPSTKPLLLQPAILYRDPFSPGITTTAGPMLVTTDGQDILAIVCKQV